MKVSAFYRKNIDRPGNREYAPGVRGVLSIAPWNPLRYCLMQVAVLVQGDRTPVPVSAAALVRRSFSLVDWHLVNRARR